VKIAQLAAVDFTMAHFLLPLMTAERDAGHEVVGICSDGPLLERVRAAGFRIEPVEIARSFNIARHARAICALTRLFRRERFDMVHVHTPVAALLGRIAAWRAGVPVVVYTAHGFYFHEHMPAHERAFHVALEWLAGRRTDVLFTQAEEDAAAARRLGLCRTGRIHAIGNGVDPARFAPRDPAIRARLRTELGAREDEIVVLMVGRLVAEKGYGELLRAMRDVAATLWIVGERLASDHATDIDAELDAAKRDPARAQRVRFMGYRTDVPDLMAAADIFTLPSHREGMPRSIIEAMMSGLPVVATDIRGSREEVVPESTGLLVPVRDEPALATALNRLAADAGLRRRMGEAGRARALAQYDEAVVIGRQLTALGLRGT
jgi:glycosyltransferase involved in cell wall biosynthesis